MMKLGCSVWSLTGRYGPPFDDAPEEIAKLGFEATELIVQSTEQMRDHFNPSQCAAMRDRLSGLGLQMSQFVVYKDMIDGLASMEPGPHQQRVGDLGAGLLDRAGARHRHDQHRVALDSGTDLAEPLSAGVCAREQVAPRIVLARRSASATRPSMGRGVGILRCAHPALLRHRRQRTAPVRAWKGTPRHREPHRQLPGLPARTWHGKTSA